MDGFLDPPLKAAVFSGQNTALTVLRGVSTVSEAESSAGLLAPPMSWI